MSNKIQIVKQKLKHSLNRKGFININHIQIESREKLAELSFLFKKPNYQILKVIYIKDNCIIGDEIIILNQLNNTKYFNGNSTGITNSEKCIYKVKEKMKMFKANKYLLVRSIPYNELKMTNKYLDIASYFYSYLNGFMGHLILNNKSYIWIDIYKNKIYIKKGIYKEIDKKTKKSFINRKFKNYKSLINIVTNSLYKTNYSILFILKIGEFPKIAIRIPNSEIIKDNMKLQEYINNLKSSYKNCAAILVSDNGNVFKDSLDFVINGTLEDTIWYTELKGNLYTYKLPNLEKHKKYMYDRGNKYVYRKRKVFENTI